MPLALRVLALSVLAGAVAPALRAQEFVGVLRTGTLQVYDGGTGCITRTLAVNSLVEINALARRPSDGHLFVAGAWTTQQPVLSELDPVSGTVLASVALPFADAVTALAFGPAGELYVVDDNGPGAADDLWRLDVQNGNASLVGAIGNFVGVQALAWDPLAGTLLGWDVGPFLCLGQGLIEIDPLTAVAVDVDPQCGVPAGCWTVQGLTVDAAGRLWGAGDRLRRLDRASGCVTWEGSCTLSNVRGLEPWSGFVLRAGGNCPAGVSAQVLGGTPGGLVVLGWSWDAGGGALPGGPCAGTIVALGAGAAPAGFRYLDAAGSASFGPRPLPAAACGALLLQALELGSCRVSNLLRI